MGTAFDYFHNSEFGPGFVYVCRVVHEDAHVEWHRVLRRAVLSLDRVLDFSQGLSRSTTLPSCVSIRVVQLPEERATIAFHLVSEKHFPSTELVHGTG